MMRILRYKVYLISTILLIFMSGCKKDNDKVSLYQELKSVDKMVFANMAITKTGIWNDDHIYTIGKRIVAYSYDSYMRAYIDLSALQQEDLIFNEKDKTVKITLPPIRIEQIGRDMNMNREYDNIGLVRSEITAKERAEIKEKINNSYLEEVVENPMFNQELTEAAQRKARKYFETLFESNGYTASIDFKK